MRFPRSSGIVLHPTSLPGRYGIGELGAEAHRFLDFLSDAGQKIWQVLPLGPTGYADSPYQCFSAFAGNPLLIDLEELASAGLIGRTALAAAELPPCCDAVDYGCVLEFKLPLLAAAAREFHTHAASSEREAFDAFTRRHAGWLDEFALFMALKKQHGGVAWTRWPRPAAMREPDALARARDQLAPEIAAQKFTQYVFFRQWQRVRAACRERGIQVLGDVPIYVAHDSADVWASPQLFRLDAEGNPAVVAGVPPDYFSATGQLWGNPIYRWDRMAQDGYTWWIERLRATLATVDMIRLDHFRGFEAYWEVPAGEATAQHGRWVKGPGEVFFEVAEKALGQLPLVAENLGVITPEVESIRARFGYPGMAILQFAFGTDPQGPSFRPHNYARELVAYTGTHDNDTTLGWWNSEAATDSTRSARDIEEERAFTLSYLGAGGDGIHWTFIRTVMASVADVALFPLQDVLGLGSEARMNLPGRPGGNWRWRFRRDMLKPELAARLKELARMYDR
ncbi:MAG TPA: 4-alpha-glucanotransferase [Bryobacteraceae bacterium]|nr:4-alpha-glucanotransferase [Bryobacteraceae bacterium]